MEQKAALEMNFDDGLRTKIVSTKIAQLEVSIGQSRPSKSAAAAEKERARGEKDARRAAALSTKVAAKEGGSELAPGLKRKAEDFELQNKAATKKNEKPTSTTPTPATTSKPAPPLRIYSKPELTAALASPRP